MLSLTPFLLFPIVGGYYFSNKFIASQYMAYRDDGHRLYFRSILYGFFMTIICIELHVILIGYADLNYINLYSIDYLFAEADLEGTHIPADDIFIVLCTTLLVGPILAGFLNKIVQFIDSMYVYVITRIMDVYANELPVIMPPIQTFFLRQAVDTYDFEMMLLENFISQIPVLFSLKNGKFYVGLSLTAPNPQVERKHIKILPLLSGYRTTDHTIKITTDYMKTYFELLQEPKDYEATIEDFDVVFPADQIISSHAFDFQIYEKLFERSEDSIEQPHHEDS